MEKEGRGQISGHGAAGNTNKRPLQPLDNSDDDNTYKPLSQPNSSNSFSTIPTKHGQNQDGTGAEHSQVEPDDKNESGTDESVEEEQQPNHQGKPVDSTGLTPSKSPNNDNDKTLNTSVQTITSNSPGKETGGAESGSKENVEGTGCTHFKTVWGLRPDLLLLTIVVVIAAVIVKFPPGAHQVVTDNPVIQQQLSDIAKQFIAKKFEDIENKIEVLESKVNTNSKTNCEQPSKLDELENNIIKINNILSPSDPDDILHPVMKTKVRENIQDITKIKTDIADVKNNHNALNRKVDRIQSELSEVKEKHKQDDSNLSRDITHIRESVTKNSNANSALSNNVSQVENDLKDLESKLHDTTSKVDAINEEMNTTNDTVSKVRTSAKIAIEIVDAANGKLEIMKQHLFNKDALTAAILILFFLIIALMLYVLKLKSSLEPSLAGGSTSRLLKGSREMKAILQKMPSNPTLDNAVCIVSFDASHSDEYKRMIKETVGQLGRVSFRTHVIRKHADIAELPHCRLFIMCVEFTRRHVIIEEQSLGLGDLKLTSYRGVRKLGGALVILYIHDPGSMNLTDDQLYSDGVYCVKKQQELMELCEIDRFISAHKNLNTAQKKALETAITHELKIQAAR